MSELMDENEISGKIIGCAIDIHRELGPGLLESAMGTKVAPLVRSELKKAKAA